MLLNNCSGSYWPERVSSERLSMTGCSRSELPEKIKFFLYELLTFSLFDAFLVAKYYLPSFLLRHVWPGVILCSQMDYVGTWGIHKECNLILHA